MTYQEWVKDVFVEDQNAYGLDIQEAIDIFEETPFKKIEKFLLKAGYDLKGDFHANVNHD